jgi:hypothetical protein
LDTNRAWCPGKDCGALCHVCTDEDDEGKSLQHAAASKSVKCQSCAKEFCSVCSGSLHPGKTCSEYGQSLVKGQKHRGGGKDADFLFALDGSFKLEGTGIDIKPCPMCRVPIERDAGCAQMMCKRCKHVFCWFCRESLDVSLLFKFLTIPYKQKTICQNCETYN